MSGHISMNIFVGFNSLIITGEYIFINVHLNKLKNHFAKSHISR